MSRGAANVTIPVVMTLAGHDPSGGAGIMADSEAVISQGCRPVSVITCLTVQDTVRVKQVQAVSPALIEQQAKALLADLPVAAIKVGLLADVETILAVKQLLVAVPDIPVILDPVLASGAGDEFATQAMVQAIREHLLPLTTLVTPNIPEAAVLAGKGASQDEHAQALMAYGCRYVLLTGTHSASERVENILYGQGKRIRTWNWERLPETYHGSGCTLAAACAANLAKDLPIITAVGTAQAYTWGSLQAGYPLGKGQWLPNRFYWTRS